MPTKCPTLANSTLTVPPSSPFDSDDGSDAAEAPVNPAVARRRRFARTRKRALVGGMLTLLALVWLRELLGLPEGLVWAISLIVLGCLSAVCVLANESTYQLRISEHRRSVRERRRAQRLQAVSEEIQAKRLAAWEALDHRCPECDGEMAWIKLVDSRGEVIRYADFGTRPHPVSQAYPFTGEAYGEVCKKCTRIVLRGVPY